MRNHVAVHDIEMNLAAPLAAIALAWMTVGLLTRGVPRVQGWIGACLIGFLIIVQPWVFGTEKSPEDPAQIMGFSAAIHRDTGPDAIVLSPLVSAIPLYYSERHLVRCISDEAMMKRVLPSIQQQYPSAPIYWATPLDAKPWAVVRKVR